MKANHRDDASVQRLAAQRRVDRIAQFREELTTLEREQALRLTPEQRSRLETHLDGLTAALVHAHGIDATDSARRTSWAMRLTALLGGAAVFTALVLLLHRIWGFIPHLLQPVILGGLPLGLLAGASWANHRRTDPFFTTLLALSAGAGFVLGLTAMGTIHNFPGSPHAVLGWSVFGLLVAYALDSRLLLAAGLLLLCAYGSALGRLLSGEWWVSWLERPVWIVPIAALLYACPSVTQRPDPRRFGAVFRGCAASAGTLALLILSFSAHFCCLGLSTRTGETLVQVAGLGLAAGILGHGVRLREPSTVNLGAIAFLAFLLIRLHSWCWDWMPKYAFLFLVGLLAVVLLLVFRRIRIRALAEPTSKPDASGSSLPPGEPADAAHANALPEQPTARPRTFRPNHLVVLAAAVVLVSNLWVLLSSRVNRQQAGGGTLALAEDELNLVPRLGESTVNLLDFHWRTSEEERRRCPKWLDAAKLATLGYDCHIPLSSALAGDHYRRLGNRPVWLVLTISDLLSPPDGEPEARPTRLTVVDAGPERAPLREQYPNVGQYAVVRGVVRLRYLDPPQEAAAPPSPVRLQGEIVAVLPSQLFVPRPFTARLDTLQSRASERADPHSPPRFHARVAWGSQSIPWLEDVQLVIQPEAASNTLP